MSVITYVDENDNVIGQGERTDALAKGIIHRISRVFVFNSQGEILIQKRSANISLPNLWDQSAAGHVDPGEDYMSAAERELREETGIQNVPLRELVKYYAEETDQGVTAKRFSTLYVGTYDGDVHTTPEEVAELRWITPDELAAWMREKPQDFTQGFIKCFEQYRQKTA